jgi:hypothetical protein
MTVRKYRYDQKLGKLVEVTGREPVSKPKGPHIWPDLKPYQVVGPEKGKWITSRSHHRAYLKEHNLIEVGGDNERKYFDPTKR